MTRVASAVPTVEVGVDYVACSAARPSLAAALLCVGMDLVAQEESAGGVLKPYYNHGFAGYQAGSSSYGASSRGAVVVCSGATARESAAELLSIAENCSRLDVQATVRVDGLKFDYAKGLYSQLARKPRGRGRPVAHTLITSNWTGDTLMIGKRISDQYGRVYNKSAEERVQEDPLRWRFEVEYKRRWALGAAKAYVGAQEKERWLASEVHDWFARRYVDPPFSASDRVDWAGRARGSSSEANRVRWLKIGVRPVVVELAAKYGWPDILSILGVPMRYTETYVNEVLGVESDY